MSHKMRLNTTAFSLKAVTAAVFSALMVANASAAGLGRMTVQSALGEPLRAEIELTVSGSEEISQLNPKLASRDAFRQANIDFSPALTSLRFAIEQRSGGRQVISVTSSQPINDPFVDLLLDLGGDSATHLVREYTFLLDPPSEVRKAQAQDNGTRTSAPLRNSQSPATVRPLPESPTTSASASDRPSQTARLPRAPQERPSKPVVAAQPAAEQTGGQQGDYHVKSGDSLSKIAGQLKPEGVSLDQMLVALYRSNRNAFIGDNMNRLRAGQVLSVPDAAAAGAISNSEAHSVIVAQTSDFNEYRNKLAGQVSSAEPQKATESRQNASGKISAKVEEKSTAAAESKDKLKLSKAGNAASTHDEEQRIAKEKELAEANSRVKALEKNVNDLQKVLEVKNRNLADQQKAADAAKAAPKPVAQAATPTPTPAPAPTPTPAPATPTPPVAAAASASASASAPAATPTPAPAAKPDTPPVASVTPPAKPPRPKPRVVAPPQTSLLDDLLGNPFILGGAALLLVGAGGFGLYSGYRRRKEKSFGDSIITDSSLKANSLFGSTGGQSVDTNNSVFNSSFAPSASQLDSNEVDPVAEADVYIAYGRDAQAEEILKEALRTQPERNAVRVKLLEIYANRKDVRSFETMASELYGMTKGEGEDWQQAASLGQSIDPKNPLYASGKGESEATTQQHPGADHTQPLDDSGLDELVRETHSRPSMSSPNTLEESPYFGSSTLGGLEPDTVARHESQPKLGGNTNLDFDLDGIDQPEAPKAAEHAPAAHAAPVVEPKADLASIDFDFLDEEKATELGAEQAAHHLETQLAEAHPEEFPSLATPTAAPKAIEPPPAEIPSLPEVAAKAAEHVPMHEPAEERTQLLDFDLSGITLELDKGAKGAAAAVAKAEEHRAMDLNVPEIPAMDFHIPEAKAPEVKLPEVAAPTVHEPKLEIPDLHAMDLHVPEIHHAVESAPAPVHHAAEPSLDAVPDLIAHGHHEAEVALDTGIDHDYSSSAEMATKLDLAVAYTEIGDKEGARELLEEVIQAGASEHADKAKALLVKLG